jgi:Cof subfamily protein (haloacid dehalogenase superfamily)
MRLVATDLDGTIVRPDGSISARTVAALRACQQAGVDVVYVTGRPPRWLADVVAQTGQAGTAICANGAIVYDLTKGEVLSASTLERDATLEAADRVARALPGTTFAVETISAGFRREPDYRARYDVGADDSPAPLDELVRDGDVVKLLCRNESSTGDVMLEAARPVLDGLASPTHSNQRDCLIEVSAIGVSKAATLAQLAGSRGIGPADVVSFGDMPNDIEMLSWAGQGYAMTGGHPDAVAAADQTAPPCVDDGVAQVLERLLRLRG